MGGPAIKKDQNRPCVQNVFRLICYKMLCPLFDILLCDDVVNSVFYAEPFYLVTGALSTVVILIEQQSI